MDCIKIVGALICLFGITFSVAEMTSPGNSKFFYTLVAIECIGIAAILIVAWMFTI